MQITKNSVVSLHYRLQADNNEGELVEETFGKEPLTFIFGNGQMIPDFEKNLEGKSVGDKHAFGISSENAYGPVNKNAIVDLPINTFVIDGELATDMLVVGKSIPMADEKGNPLMGKIQAISETSVTMDFNHPMAGQDLFFTIEVTGVREATASELDHGHVHGPGGVEH